jgi:murein DD-endopeptidase MepM/ murein hydrolase activator NlpD
MANNDGKDNSGGLFDVMNKSMGAANAIKGAVKAGKAIAGIAKGTAAGGPYGAIAAGLAGLWSNRKSVGKIIAAAALVFMIPVLFVLMLPSIIFGTLFGGGAESAVNIMNDNAAIMQNISEIESAVGAVLRESHDSVLAAIESEKLTLEEGTITAIIDDYSIDILLNCDLIITQYCAHKDNYENIKLNDLIKILRANKDNLFSYTSETEIITETDDENNEIVVSKITYTIKFAGESYFAENIFMLTEEQAELAGNYAENLHIFLSEDYNSQSAAVHKSLKDLLTTYPYDWTDGDFHSPFADMDWQSRVTSEYGSRIDPITGAKGEFHTGIDIAYPQGTPIRAAKSGIVVVAEKKTTGYGNRIVINHGGGYSTLYAHCDTLLVSVGDRVEAGEKIATVGSTGRSTGPHLHFEVIFNEATRNPREYIGW